MNELAQDSESHEQSDAPEKLGQESGLLQALIDTVPSFLWTSFPDGSKEFLNRRWYEYTGLTPEQGKGWGWKVVVHPDDLDRLIRAWLDLLHDPKPGELETRIRRYDGEYRWFLIRVLPEFDAEGNVVRWLGSDTDIEDRKRVETKLLKDERELRQITDAIPHTIAVLDPKGKALYANQTMLDYTGLTMQDVLASDFRARTFHPEDLERVDEARQAGFARGLPFEIELRALRKDGQYRWLLFRYNPLRDEEERLVRWYATGTDIDDRKRAEDRTQNENVALREDIVRSSMFEEIVGSSETLRRVLVHVSKVAPTDSTVLVLGETGTGKELIARAIHNRSKRSNRAFIRVNCAAIPQSLIASELFGHEKGSFTGATQRRLGRFESADGGTIFLDEVGDLPPETQVALLRVLQEREFERVGGSQTVSVDVRVIAATNRDLSTAVAEGKFRQDLFYRLNVVPIRLPALRERISDISLLVGYLIDRYAKKLGKKIRNIDKKTIELFYAYDWPGNIRELQNVVERAVILSEGETFFVDETWLTHLAPKLAATTAPLVADLVKHEREILEAALRESEGVVGGRSGAAVKLGIPRQTLESKIRKLGINRHRFKAS
ncbi:MAG TPA: sigma-54-dependent Fis family transcriptional regulator [Candidatus Sulfotelmatobacter sp.]|jgi:formate hydrogenlyase transcriptional activator